MTKAAVPRLLCSLGNDLQVFTGTGGHDAIQLIVLREMILEGQNDIAVKQQAFAGAGVGHIGQLMWRDVELLGKDGAVACCLGQHANEVRVLKDVLYFLTGQQIFDILSDSSGDLKCD